MSAQHILVVEDESDIRELLRFNLEREGFSVLEAEDGQKGLELARRHLPCLIILDVMLPALDGFEGLSLGADDYVVKPFSVRELMLRIKAILRRGGRVAESALLERHGIRLRPDAHTASAGERELVLTATEFRLLEDLLRHAGTVRTREQLLNNVWGYSFEGYARTVDTHVRRLRSKLGEAAAALETVRGVGYRIRE